MAEVKRAYRRLAKTYHPDSAGEAALPRFLAIHEAYESIRTGRPITPGRRGASNQPAPEPWRADPDRARSAREQARRRAGTRGGPAGAAGAGAGAGPGTRSGPRSGGPSGTAGGTDAGGRTGTSGRGGGARGGRRHVRKATMGSTSYDEARDPKDPNDPTWSGASWYGPSTGEYWIINPREYADPRKHGPEYQSRARRMAAAAALGDDGEVESEAELGAPGPEPGAEDAPQPRARGSTRGDTSTATGEAAWTFTSAAAAPRPAGEGDAAGARAAAARAAAAGRAPTPGRARQTARPARPVAEADARPGTGPGEATWGTAWPSDARTLRRGARARRRAPTPRELVGGPADDPIRRLGVALVAWPPIGLAAAAVIGDVTGCAVYSAECGGTEPLLPWLAQAAILGLLLLLPPIARLLAGGAIGVLVAVVPLTAFLVAVGGSGAPQAGYALSFLLGGAWVVGVAWALAQTRRRGFRGSAT